MPTTAQYHGTCTECGEIITPGQRITRDDEGWHHHNCGERPTRVECVCQKCFLVHAPSQEVCW